MTMVALDMPPACPCSMPQPSPDGDMMMEQRRERGCRRRRRRLPSSSSPATLANWENNSASPECPLGEISRSQTCPLTCGPRRQRRRMYWSGRIAVVSSLLLCISCVGAASREREAADPRLRRARRRRIRRGGGVGLRRRTTTSDGGDIDMMYDLSRRRTTPGGGEADEEHNDNTNNMVYDPSRPMTDLSSTLLLENDGPSTFVSTADTVDKTVAHITHCEKQALQYNNTHVNMSLVPSMRSDSDSDNPFSPRSVDGSTNNDPVARCVSNYAYDAANGVRYPCKNVDLLSFIPLTTMHQAITWKYGPDNGYGIGNDVWGWTHEPSNREFALMGFAYGTAIVEVTAPVRPRYLGVLAATDRKRNKWHDVKVKRDVAYVVSEQSDHGLQVFDLTRLLNLSPSYSRVLQPDNILNGAQWFGKAHNLVINQGDDNSNLLMAVGVDTRFCDGGMFIMDISDPLNPTRRTCYGGDGYVHDAECVTYRGPDQFFQDTEICFAYNEDTLTIIDVDAPLYEDGFIRILSRFDDPNNSWVYTHQGSLTEDMKYVLLDDEGDESARNIKTTTYVVDVSQLRYPRYVGEYVSTERATDHNQYVVGKYSYQANYDAGLRVLRIDDPENPRIGLAEEAYFDIEPGRDSSEMKGAWSVYPYFSSGTILVSSTEEGLFVFRANLQEPPCPRSSEGCGSNALYTNDFLTGGKSYSRIKTIAQPSLPRGGNGRFVGRVSIPGKRKRQVAFENVDVSIDGSRTIQLVAKVGLMNIATKRYKFSLKIYFDNEQVVRTPRMMLGAAAHNSYQYYRKYVDVPFGAQRIVKVEYRIVKPAKICNRNVLLIDNLSINRDIRGSIGAIAASRSAGTGNGDSGYNIFRFKAPREGNL